MPADKGYDKLGLYRELNPKLTDEEISTLLFIDRIYEEIPDDVDDFRRLFTHLDPSIIEKGSEGVMFLKIVDSLDPPERIKEQLNAYINIKYNFFANAQPYERNMDRFCLQGAAVSRLIDDLLVTARLPPLAIAALREKPDVRECQDFYHLLTTYRNTDDQRIKFEILRKIGLIVLLSRIQRSSIVEEIDWALAQVMETLSKGLGLMKKGEALFYYWLDAEGKVEMSRDHSLALARHKDACAMRSLSGRRARPLHEFRSDGLISRTGQQVLHIKGRNKLRDGDEISYSSIIEKIIRKNLEFPNQVHDIIGVKIVVDDESDIPGMIRQMEGFLGGTSTRKMEKNSFDKFGKHKLSKYSSKDYFVWKAIYDITLPHPSIPKVREMIDLTRGNAVAQEALKERLRYFTDRPLDVVVEIQVLGLQSFLLSIADGSTTDHQALKMKQIRSNSFYKFFPKEIYESELMGLRKRIFQKR